MNLSQDMKVILNAQSEHDHSRNNTEVKGQVSWGTKRQVGSMHLHVAWSRSQANYAKGQKDPRV